MIAQASHEKKASRMFKKNGMEKRLKKINRQEEAGLRLLEKQESELVKAIHENDKLVELLRSKQSPTEIKIREEISKLTAKLKQLNHELEKVILLIFF